MTLEELLDSSAAKLKAMSDAELQEHFKKYFTVTRPELAPRPAKKELFDPEALERKQKLAKLAELGIDVSALSYKKKGGKR